MKNKTEGFISIQVLSFRIYFNASIVFPDVESVIMNSTWNGNS